MRQIEKYLDEVKRDTDSILEEQIPAAEVEPRKLHEAMRWSVFAGGKRIRPAIVLAVGEALGADRRALISTAAAIEMVHTYSLIHDDLPSMDNDDLRRGKATCHRQFGEATAILAGDVLQTIAFKTIADDENLAIDIRIQLVSLLAQASGSPGGMASGQQMDLEAEGRTASLAVIEHIHRQKTGALILAAARSGSIIARADKGDRVNIDQFAERLGLLFQVTDDLLDVTQGTQALGKTAGKDASASKATFPSHLGVEGTRKLIGDLHKDALDSLVKVKGNTSILRALTEFVVERSN